ncbi:ABC transporter A family member 1 [Dendrobium catenatum]|uniref:ABC transporter A family member 1 n=1 Tax=Dendrobium catenatum TaxID=906689 RepID=A0A2I0VRM1_9ASPA|nr:ABC transporter A family member 1 [Dendrobium catenatum]
MVTPSAPLLLRRRRDCSSRFFLSFVVDFASQEAERLLEALLPFLRCCPTSFLHKRLSPAFCFADGLASLALRHQDMKLGSKHQILDWNITGASLCYLAVEIIVYFLLTISLEYIPHYKIKFTASRVWWYVLHYVKYDTSQSCSEPLLGSFGDSLIFITDEDEDVTAERQRVLNGVGEDAIICLRNLRKVYPAGKKHVAKVAVHSLTFAVHEGECFGFLGTNGAGKTTTLSMLTGKCTGYLFY